MCEGGTTSETLPLMARTSVPISQYLLGFRSDLCVAVTQIHWELAWGQQGTLFSAVRGKLAKEMSQEKRLILPESRRDLSDLCSGLPPDDSPLCFQGHNCQSSGPFQFKAKASSLEMVRAVTGVPREKGFPPAELTPADLSCTLAPNAAPWSHRQDDFDDDDDEDS